MRVFYPPGPGVKPNIDYSRHELKVLAFYSWQLGKTLDVHVAIERAYAAAMHAGLDVPVMFWQRLGREVPKFLHVHDVQSLN